MKKLRYGSHGEVVYVYHHVVLGLASIKGCPLLNEDCYYTHSAMTAEWFNRIVDWLCTNYPKKFVK